MSLAAKPRNAIFVIAPYWLHGTWVFDDPEVGLSKEPFVSGVPEILNDLVADIPDARKGFRLIFSDAPFPGYQGEFIRTRQEYSGTWYKSTEAGGKEGWLCPALFKYYSEAPERIYIKAESL